jgi:hypothetical protein
VQIQRTLIGNFTNHWDLSRNDFEGSQAFPPFFDLARLMQSRWHTGKGPVEQTNGD